MQVRDNPCSILTHSVSSLCPQPTMQIHNQLMMNVVRRSLIRNIRTCRNFSSASSATSNKNDAKGAIEDASDASDASGASDSGSDTEDDDAINSLS